MTKMPLVSSSSSISLLLLLIDHLLRSLSSCSISGGLKLYPNLTTSSFPSQPGLGLGLIIRLRRRKLLGLFVRDRLCNIHEDDGNDSDASSVLSDQSCMSESEAELETRRKLTSLPRSASLNAFDIISFSPGFDLSGLFKERGEEARFVSGAPVDKIISKLEEIAKVVSFSVRKKDCRVSLEGSREGVKGPLTIAAEIFELTPSLVVLEVKKKAGDRTEYEQFCNAELRPGLQNLMIEESLAGSLASGGSMASGGSVVSVGSPSSIHNLPSYAE